MSRGRSLKEHDLPVQMAGASAAVVNVTGGGGTSTNADTVDGYHAAAVPMAGRLLALDAAARFPASVIDWDSVAGAGLEASGDTLRLAATVAGDGLDLTAGVLSVKTGTGVRIVSDAVAIDTHTHQDADQGGKVDHGAALTGLLDDDHTIYALVNPLTSARNTIQAGADDVTPITVKAHSASQSANLWEVEDSTGAVLLQVNEAGDLESADFQSGIRGWQVSHGGTAEFHNAYVRGELHATVFVKDLIEAHAGTLGIFKSGGKLASDLTTPAVGSTTTLTVTDPPGGGFLFSAGDWVRIKAPYAGGVYDVWGQVTAPVDNGDGTQSYTFTRRSGGTVGGTIPAGVAVADYGASGQGYLLATADLNYAPYLDVASWAGADPYTGGNHTVHVRLGLLDGLSGIGAEWGLWAGKDSGHYLQLTDTTALIRGIKQQWVDSGDNIRGEVDPAAGAGDYLFWLGPSSGNKRFGVTGDGTVYIGNVPSQNIAGWAHASDLTRIDGGMIQANTVTAQQMTVTMMNMVDNPGFESGTVGWQLLAGSSIGTWGGRSGNNLLVGDGNRASGASYALSDNIPVYAGQVYYAEIWCYVSTGSRNTGMTVSWRDRDGAHISYSDCYGATGTGWTRHSRLITAPANAAFAVLILAQWGTPNAAAPRWDDVVFRPASGMNLVVGTPGSARVEINNAGIEGRDSANVVQFQIRTDNGRATFGAGHGVLDASGLKLDGNQTSIQNYASVLWRTDPANSASTEVARISGGRTYEIVEASAWVPHLYMAANRANAYPYSKAELVGYGGASNSYNQLLLDYGWGYSSAILRTVYEGSTRAEVRVTRDQFNFGWVQAIIEGTSRLQVYRDGIQVTGRIGIGTPPSYPLHIQTGDLVPIYIRHTGTAPRVLTTILRNTTDTGWLEWHQQFGSGDTPAWQFVRVDRPDGSGAGFLTALSIGWNGDIYIHGNCSAASFTDRTPYPDRDTALAAVRSLKQAEGKVGSLDHEALHEYVRARNKSGETGRNLSATVSAQNVVIQELLRRIELLEKDRRVS